MQEQLKKVSEFHQAFHVEENDEPTLVPEKTFLLRHKLMAEENDEYLQACATNDLVEIGDALADKTVILLGTINLHGMQHIIVDLFNEVMRSNMSKLDSDGNPIFREDGKILKSPQNYSKPDLAQYIKLKK